MSTEPIIIDKRSSLAATEARQSNSVRSNTALADYWSLTKPEINFLIAIATCAGFYLGCAERFHDLNVLLLIHTLVGTLLVASGTGTLNQYIERRFDAQMRRTARRPVASGRLKPTSAFWFGMGLSAAGSVYLAVFVNSLASLLAILTLISYLFLYTPLKRKTALCVLVGAFSGAMPPLIGYAAAKGRLSLEAWVPYTVVFLWQFPHFMAIAWIYREDYARAGYRVLPEVSRERFVKLQTVIPLLALIPISLVPTPPDPFGLVYSVGAMVFNLGFCYCGAQFVLRRSSATARQLLLASIVYLPALLILMIVGRT